eukprot:CAMPEP_0205941932 /NCGR_PEP_ID=MMETSP1325-20131115/56215_1 /ASSEMBLY_ACC=CAM_ASM_000708 /TAXON_ID=236786 /ORGANISM="Florenciella sp., Strain RCC1007" /LENGTH=46 /DNA_ID= /DNA_START= /DNA_END= /DNA_ORIENTATION=
MGRRHNSARRTILAASHARDAVVKSRARDNRCVSRQELASYLSRVR